MKIFISYCNDDGFAYAVQATSILERYGHTTWYFDRNKTPGVLRIVDITQQIRYWCDIILYLCTGGSLGSRGQWEEIGQWDSTNKQIIVVTIDNAIVPEVIDTRIYAKVKGRNFVKEFSDFVNNDLDRAITMFQEWNKLIKVEKKQWSWQGNKRDQSTMKKRDMNSIKGREAVLRTRSLQITSLRKTSPQLLSNRVIECKKALLESYEQSTISKQIANVIYEKHIENYRFRSIGFYHAINISEFNNESYYWQPYFSDIGRIIAQNERQYIHRRIARFVRGEEEKISRSRPDFSILSTLIEKLNYINIRPNIILAPVEMLPSFAMYYRDNLVWSQSGEQLIIGNSKLNVIWSHRYAKLRSFLIFDSKASTWHTLPDDENKEQMITVAFGKSERDLQKVAYWIEVIAYYEITNPLAFRRVNLCP